MLSIGQHLGGTVVVLSSLAHLDLPDIRNARFRYTERNEIISTEASADLSSSVRISMMAYSVPQSSQQPGAPCSSSRDNVVWLTWVHGKRMWPPWHWDLLPFGKAQNETVSSSLGFLAHDPLLLTIYLISNPGRLTR